MTCATSIPVVRKLACAFLLAAMAASVGAGVLAEGAAIAGELYAASLVGVGSSARKPPRAEPAIPAALAAPGERRVDRIAATGVQVYECRAKAGDVHEAEWALVAAEAEVRGACGQAAGRYYAGPHREAPDGSHIVGTVGGVAPARRCDASTIGAVERVPYTADHLLRGPAAR